MFDKLFKFLKLNCCNKITTSEKFDIEFKDNEDYDKYKAILKLKDYWTRGKKKNG